MFFSETQCIGLYFHICRLHVYKLHIRNRIVDVLSGKQWNLLFLHQ